MILDDLRYLSKVRGSDATPLHRKIFQSGVDGRSYLRWFQERIKRIGLGSCRSYRKQFLFFKWKKVEATACLDVDDRLLILEKIDAFQFPNGRWDRLQFLFHEARHADGPNHEICAQSEIQRPPPDWDHLPNGVPKINDPFNCDRAANGSYGTAAVALYNIAYFCENCDKFNSIEAMNAAEKFLPNVVGEDARRILNADLVDWQRQGSRP